MSFYAIVLSPFNTANFQRTRTSSRKVYAHRRELFRACCKCMSLGGNLKRETDIGTVTRLFLLFKMKKILCLLLLAFVSFTAVVAKSTMHLAVCTKDGSKVLYALEEKPKITFTDTELIITTKSVEIAYALSDMNLLTYENGETTGITNLHDNSDFKLDGNAIVFSKLKAKDIVSLYSINGVLVFKKTVTVDGEYAVSLNDIETGVYVVSVNGLTYKFMKK